MAGYLIWEGTSRLDHKTPILMILTLESANGKTGPMHQVWYIPKPMHPTEAAQQQLDFSVCGSCRGRPSLDNWCYVPTGHGPGSVYKAWLRGNYPKLDLRDAEHRKDVQGKVRLGAWGDPAAVPPAQNVRVINACAEGWTSYTHQFAKRPATAEYSMVSVDSREQYEKVHAEADVRTFRFLREGESLADGEMMCPHETKGTQCIDCRLCDGNSRLYMLPSIAVSVHGAKKGNA